MSSANPNPDDGLTHRAVFISYAREDTAAAQLIADALRSQGVEVWFDQAQLRGGDAWDQKIRRLIKECVLFMPIISERTQARGEGYFRLEWKLAVERTHLMAEGVIFLAPVVVDATLEGAAVVPPEFLRVQWIRLPGSLPTPQFVEQVKGMLSAQRKAGAPASPTPSAMAAPPPRTGYWAVAALAVAAVAVAFSLVLLRRSPEVPPAVQAGAPVQAVDPKSIAVLPFENMSDEKKNAFFTDGVHEDVLTNLAFIRDLNLVSRTSVMGYRGTTKSIKQVGRELGVAYVLQGSVRREGNRVRVTGQLVDARTDKLVWAKSYDRDLTDIFAIQGELAQAIAGALQSVLSPETKALLARRPTENSAAYDDYLKARQLRNSSSFGDAASSISFLEEAVRLDPGFAPAWAELGSRRAYAHFKVEEAGQLSEAKRAIDTAVRLAPDDPAVIEGLGDYYYYGHRDYTRATEQYLRLAQMRPNDPEMYYSLGLIERRQGRMSDAILNLRRALKLDPANYGYAVDFAFSLAYVHHYDEAEAVARRYLEGHPNSTGMEWALCTVTFMARGSTTEMDAAARRTVDPSEHGLHLYLQGIYAQARGDWAEFARVDREQRYYDGNPDEPRWNQDVRAAEVFAESGDTAASRTRASEALALMKSELGQQPDNSTLWAGLSLANALLGDRDETLRCAKMAAELMPESRDAIIGTANSIACANALAWIGEKDRALAEYERLLHVPFGTNIYEGRVAWRPLRDDPRFKKLVSDPGNNGPLL
jgi:TolB-like protein/cytochrome c-type biogenesis protein CcmH/NrfG